ncbi:hypothetical protein T459_34887 [Capsicum annuum]|uniref:Uncharacterized protein n=1 Tax=Capsicum annuum TaxID=4072 RepID=A0A2G2XUU6_CAPAN|nr:hypothetical protein T459_34887 [Capsicum annuum]
MVRQGSETTGLSPSLTSPSRGIGSCPPLRTLLKTAIQKMEPPNSKDGLFLVRSPLLRESLPRMESEVQAVNLSIPWCFSHWGSLVARRAYWVHAPRTRKGSRAEG